MAEHLTITVTGAQGSGKRRLALDLRELLLRDDRYRPVLVAANTTPRTEALVLAAAREDASVTGRRVVVVREGAA